MGLIDRIFSALFGNGQNVIVETAQVFRENAENSAQRSADIKQQALAQFASEFAVTRRGRFDQVMDALNRLPRPLLAYGTIGLFVFAMIDPVWFSTRMQGIALVPDPLWWLMGAIVSFYFGARHQAHSQDFQRSIADTLSRVPTVIENTRQLETLRADPPDAPIGLDRFNVAPEFSTQADMSANSALAEWEGQSK